MTLRPGGSVTVLQTPLNETDHSLGPREARVTLVEYGDYECPHCGKAEVIISDLLKRFDGRVRYAFRHFPLVKFHKHARVAAEAAEAASAQGRYFEMHRQLFAHQDALDPEHLLDYAREIGLDLDRFREDVNSHRFARRVQESMADAMRSGVTGTPTLFINNHRHAGYDATALAGAIEAALATPDMK